jgi:diaminopimelate epimerase
VRFSKFHGLGNDFVVVDMRGDAPAGPAADSPEAARALCDRRFGVGADGVLAVLPATTSGADARMRVINADGSEAEMCGNGLRCVAKYLFDTDPRLHRDRLTIDTGAGPLACSLHIDGDELTAVTVNMGAAHLRRADIPMSGPAGERCVASPLPVAGRDVVITAVSMGNPHAVAFVPETGATLREMAENVGPAVEVHEWFPRRTNAEFAHVRSPTDIELVVWERGCGITLACGTGACATAAAACLNGLSPVDTDITVHLPGGDLSIRVAPSFDAVHMSGPAVLVYTAELDLSDLLAHAHR